MENQTPKRQKADIDLEIKLPNAEKPFYNKLSTQDNMIKQIKKAGSKLDEHQTIDVLVNKNISIVLSKEDILNDNLKDKILDRINLLGKIEKSTKSIDVTNEKNNNQKSFNNREINKGMENQHNTNPQNTTNIEENKNFKFLKDQIKYLGLGEDPKMLKNLESNINSNAKSFELKIDYDKASFQNKVSFQLNFNRSESTGNYFLNTYKTNLQNEKRNVNIDHTFAVKENGFTAKQALNLLEGRAVLAQITNPKTKEQEPAFVRLKLDDAKNENGNFKLQVYNKNYGVDATKIVEHSKLKFDDEKHKDITVKSLEKGNIVNVKFEHDNKVINGKAVLNPQYKTLNLYDENMKRVNTNKAVIAENQEMDNNSKNNYKQSR